MPILIKSSSWSCTLLVATVIVTSSLNSACSRAPETPDTQVRALIAVAEAAAEKKNTKELRDLVSDEYSDSQGQDKKAIESILRYYFLRNESIHLLTRIQSITPTDAKHVQAIVYVAMAGTPIADSRELRNIRASLHRFEITFFLNKSKWLVSRAEWRQAELSDFIQ